MSKDISEVIENSYFFGQYMAYQLIIKIIHLFGAEQAMKFVEKKCIDIGTGNPEFVIKAEEITEKQAEQYFKDSMESRNAFIKEKKEAL